MALVLNGSGITSANIADGTITTDDILASDVKNLKSGRKNLIINGDFRVSQRGDYTTATSASDGTYYLDRWKLQVTTVTATVQDTTLKQKIAATSSGSGNIEALQTVEDFNILTNKTITVSAKVTSNSSDARIVVKTAAGVFHNSTTHTGGGSEETLSVTFSSGSATVMHVWCGITGASRVSVSITSGDYIEFKEVQLELGSVATDFEHRSYGEELALCQRYYQKSYGEGEYAADNSGDSTVSFIPTGGFYNVLFPCVMRVVPSIVTYRKNGGATNQAQLDTNGGVYKSLNTASINTKGFAVSASASSNGYRFHYLADAEL